MSFNANDCRYEIDSNGGRDMGAVKRTVDFAHALQHDDPLASPTRVTQGSNRLARRPSYE